MKTKQFAIIFAILVFFGCALFAQETTNTLTSGAVPGSADSVLDALKAWDVKLNNLPFGVLVFIAVFIINSILYYVHFFPDRLIPICSMCLASVCLTVFAVHDPALSKSAFIMKNTLIGVISGAFSWIAAFKWGKAWVEKIAKPSSVPMILLTASLSFFIGCSMFDTAGLKPAPVAEGQDVVVVNLERIQATSLTTYKHTIEWETSNRAVLPAEVSRAIDKTRREFPKAWRDSRKILFDYKAARGTNIDAAMKVTAALSAAQTAMLDLRADQNQTTKLFDAIGRLSQNISALRNPQPVTP